MERLLQAGLTELGLPTEGIPSLLRFSDALVERNKVMNLTAITEPDEIATLHFLDCAALLTLADLKDQHVVDVGTGAGFPGMPLKILEPSIHITLLDSLNKRIDFLKEVCADLSLTEIDCIHGRAEEFAVQHREQFDYATSRAVANLQMLSELCLPLVKVGGAFLAMKAVDSDAEIEQAQKAIGILGGKIEKTITYRIPGTNIDHRLVIIRKVKTTPSKYPRSFAKIKKNPL